MTVKTAVSMDVQLFRASEALAREIKVSRSRLIGMALEDFLRRRRDRAALVRLNAVYGSEGRATAPETRARRKAHRRIVEGTW